MKQLGDPSSIFPTSFNINLRYHTFTLFFQEIAGEEGFRATFMPAPFQGLEMGTYKSLYYKACFLHVCAKCQLIIFLGRNNSIF